MMKKIIKSFVLVVFLSMISCDDFLDKKPHASIASEDAIETLEDCTVALNGVYLHFKTTGYYGKNLVLIPDLLTNNAMAARGYSNTYGIMHQWIFNAGTEEITSFWGNMYGAIVNASNLIDQIDEVPGDQSVKSNIKGQALLSRAIAHFDLVRLFAKTYNSSTAANDPGVPVITKFAIEEPPRNSVKEVYDQILSDAHDALSLITDNEADANTLTIGAANAFLARVYLTMRDWDNAIKYSSVVISNAKYELAGLDDYEDVFLNDRGKEIVWKIALTTGDAANHNPGYYYFNDSQGKPKPDYIPSNAVLDMYDQDNDVRFFTFFNEVETAYGWTQYLVSKFPTNPAFVSTTNANGANMPKVFRLSEQYLIRAEAYSEKGGKDPEALQDLNDLRRKRIEGYADETGLSGSALKNAIWQERQKELAYEGHFWFDLKRKGLGFKRQTQENAVSGLNYDGLDVNSDNYRWLFPIPQSEINANSSINENNPGY